MDIEIDETKSKRILILMILIALAGGAGTFFAIRNVMTTRFSTTALVTPSPSPAPASTGVETELFRLKVGGQYQTNELITVKLLQVTEDSRCPATVQCVWQGRLVAEIELFMDQKKQNMKISTDANEVMFENRIIRLMEVTPSPHEPGKQISQSEYQIMFVIES